MKRIGLHPRRMLALGTAIVAIGSAADIACAAPASDMTVAPAPGDMTVGAAGATPAACGPERLSFLQRRILQKAEQGPAALRQYVWITRSLFGLDMMESLEFVERYRTERARCGTTSSG